MDVGGLTVKGPTLPHPLTIQNASLALAPQKAQLKSFNGTIGSSDLQATGTIDNLLAYAMRDDTLRGTASVRSNKFNLDEWMTGGGDLQIIPVPPKIDFGLDATVAELTYSKLKMTNARGKLRVKDQRVTLEDFRLNTLGGEIGLTGFYETTNPTKPAFDMGLKMTKLDIPAAFQAFTTVQMLAPVAKYAVGDMTTDVHVNGALGKNMMPLLAGLTGAGKVQTTNLDLKDFPPLQKVVDVTKLQFLDNPGLNALRTAFQIKEGRLFVQPFDVKIGGTTVNVAGSNGLDQSMQYTLGLKVPRSMLGGGANEALAGLMSKAGQAGVNLSAASEIPLDIQLGGSVTSPTVKADVGSLTSSVTSGATDAVKAAATRRWTPRRCGRWRKRRNRRREFASRASRWPRASSARATLRPTRSPPRRPIRWRRWPPSRPRIRSASRRDSKAASIVAEANKRADDLVAQAKKQAGVK